MIRETNGTNDYWEGLENLTAFSFFLKPIHNIEPYRAITVVDVYRYVTGHYAKKQTLTLRSIESPKEAKLYKATHFDYCTFSGIFRKRNEREIITHSGLMCLDFDHVTEPEGLKQKLINHEYFDTELMFTSPSGDGVKWIISVDLRNWEHSRYFKSGTAQGHNRKLLAQIITVYHTKTLDGVGGCTIRPMRTYFLPFRAGTILQNIFAHIDK